MQTTLAFFWPALIELFGRLKWICLSFGPSEIRMDPERRNRLKRGLLRLFVLWAIVLGLGRFAWCAVPECRSSVGPSGDERDLLTIYQMIREASSRIPAEVASGLDTYSLSPGYFLMTGRSGLSVFQTDSGLVPIIAHPNRPGARLIFPPIGGERITSGFVELWKAQAPDAVASRLTERHVEELRSILPTVDVVREEVLDWKFPVVVIENQRLVDPQGSDLAGMRRRLRAFDRQTFSLREIVPEDLLSKLTSLGSSWAAGDRFAGYTQDDLLGPTARLCELARAIPGSLSCLGLYHEHKAIGFAIYEPPLLPNAPANLFASVVPRDRPGGSYLLYHLLAQRLASLGVSTLNLGGSETEGLHDFKRRLAAVRLIPLWSARLPGQGSLP